MAKKKLTRPSKRAKKGAPIAPKSPHADLAMRVWRLYQAAVRESLGEIDGEIHEVFFRHTDAPDFPDRLVALEAKLQKHTARFVTVDRQDLQLLADGAAQVSEGLTCLLSEEAAK